MSAFRKKKMERINSPDQMDDYIRVTTPAVWITLFALVVMLVLILAWCIFGTVELHDADGNPVDVHLITYVTN